MKTFAILTVASLALVGCNQRSDQMNEPAGAAKDQIEQSKDAQQDSLNQQKENIEQSAEQAKDQLSAQAKAEKERVESQAEAQKAQLDAQKKQVEAQADAAKADVNAQEKINEAAGATATPAEQSAAQTLGTESSLAKQVRESLTSQNASLSNVNIMEADGKVTLTGTVKTEAEKQNLEAQAKAVQGVQSVDNKLEVKSE